MKPEPNGSAVSRSADGGRPNRFRRRNQQTSHMSPVGAPPGGFVSRESELPVDLLAETLRDRQPLLSVADAVDQAHLIKATAGGLGIVDRLLAEPDVTEIMVNGTSQIWVERNGEVLAVQHQLSGNGLHLIIERMLSPLGLRLDRLQPIVDARLPDGSRVNVVAPPLAVDGPLISIRRFAADPLPMSAFGPADVGRMLSQIVKARKSILVVGPTSSGKTSLLNSLSRCIAEGERIVTIEDTAELQLVGSHIVRLEARPANSEGVGEVSLRQLVTTALRLRPDRLVVGEVRGAEAFDLLLALTAGHAGSLCTCHAADAASGLRRLQMLASLADANLSSDLLGRYVTDAIDVVVTVGRRGSQRGVVAIHKTTPGIVGAELANGPGGVRQMWPAPAPTTLAPQVTLAPQSTVGGTV